MKTRISLLAVALCLQTMPLLSQEKIQGAAIPQDAERTHNELRALRDGLVKATNEGNIDALLLLLHPNVVVTWQNGEVSRGQAGVREYLTRMTSGPNKIVSSFRTAPTVDDLTILYGDGTGISFGASHDHFELAGGMTFDLDGRWSATLVREGGRWLVASFHASADLFDNPVLALTKRTTYWAGIGGLVAGCLIGILAMVILQRRHRQAA